MFSRDSQCLQDLINLIQLQNHRTLVIWALDCASGKIKMPIAKQAILASHAVAKEINDSEYAALCHAIGHAGATVHVETHALGLPFYELTAIVLRHGKDNFPKPVSEKINCYYNRLQYWERNAEKLGLKWAGFLMDDIKPNKERLLSEKRQLKQRGIIK